MNVLTKNTALIAALVVGLSSNAFAEGDIEDAGPQYVAGGQYTAVLAQTAGNWQLLPLDGDDRSVAAADCQQSVYLPSGVWLINRDIRGRPELVAPSTTALPKGLKDRVKLIACDAPKTRESALRAPRELVQYLAEHTGAVRIDN
jgi:hypothetical protein